ncbi:DUF4355 domain-containing protein [Enterocloster lavalensis]|uniref:Uncharacterized protein n=1 Tax=Enterocloster lavalensis TaxID=460384 RepID=A0A1I0K9J0_9FIRM|nr:DUF4355 domain-containing protein [Enterocloster lavalensis]PST28748.1 DUF4355 domain-containing protein [Enterocloster lavalensis]SEU20878.1 protein of unknown function [Enterocloster lavalensis]
MRKRFYRGARLPFNLQFFAEGGDAAGAEGGNGGGTEPGGDGTTAEGEGEKPKTLDDLLKDGTYQAEFDRRMQKGIETALEKQRSKYEALMSDKLSEAEKLAKMTKEEKAEYQSRKKEKELADREAACTRRELMAEAKNTLAEKKMPVKLAELLVYTDADACKKSMEALEAAWQEAVEAGVQEQLKGGTPMKKAPTTPAVTKEQFAKMGYMERLKLKTETPELYKQLAGK